MATTKIGLQREVMEQAFDKLGGIDTLIDWANELDKDGNKPNYKEFIKLYVKLAPPLKTEADKNDKNQEGFIMSLIKEQNILKLKEGRPETIIDVDVETQ